VRSVGSDSADTLAREHPALLDSAMALLADLGDFGSRLRPGRVAHAQHGDFTERALSLRMYLESSLHLAVQDEYMPAFAVVRAALEHHLTDRLLFLARRYKRVLTGVKKATYEEWLGDWKGKKPGTEDIVKLEWRNGTVIVVRTGLHPTGGKKGPSERTLSIYYFLLQDFDPFVGRPEEQRYLARGFTSIDQHIRHAANQQRLYGESLRWDGIKSNLAYNRLCSAEMLRRFEVNYRFLSAFVHPLPAGFDLIYGRNRPSGAPRYDHYASELILLYINKIAADELKALKRMAGRPPRVQLGDWSSVEARVRRADAVAEHLWFPGDRPDHFDYVEEANSRGLRRGNLVPAQRRPTPSQLKVSQIRYYRNPLRRLIRMHTSFQELTGFAYRSPWPRQDARFR
jgi:hypothetical protein